MPYSSSWSQAWSHLTQYLVPNSVNTYLQYIYVCILAASHNPIGIGNHSYSEAAKYDREMFRRIDHDTTVNPFRCLLIYQHNWFLGVLIYQTHGIIVNP